MQNCIKFTINGLAQNNKLDEKKAAQVVQLFKFKNEDADFRFYASLLSDAERPAFKTALSGKNIQNGKWWVDADDEHCLRTAEWLLQQTCFPAKKLHVFAGTSDINFKIKIIS